MGKTYRGPNKDKRDRDQERRRARKNKHQRQEFFERGGKDEEHMK